MRLTAATITDEQIRELWELCITEGKYLLANTCACALRNPKGMNNDRKRRRRAARARCAEILNARQGGK